MNIMKHSTMEDNQIINELVVQSLTQFQSIQVKTV